MGGGFVIPENLRRLVAAFVGQGSEPVGDSPKLVADRPFYLTSIESSWGYVLNALAVRELIAALDDASGKCPRPSHDYGAGVVEEYSTVQRCLEDARGLLET